MPLLTDSQIEDALRALPGWARDGNAIVRQFTFGSFPEAVAFVNRLVPHAEAADHHPDLLVSYRRVTVRRSGSCPRMCQHSGMRTPRQASSGRRLRACCWSASR